MATRVRKWGNSIAVRLPKLVAEAASLSEGMPVTIMARDGRITVEPVRASAYRLGDLVRKINRRNRHGAVDSGKPRGREVW
jgi:antitoxin MazE